MFFGLTNSPATFQAMMDEIFGDLILAGKLVIYMDNILIYSPDLQEHQDTVNKVLRHLRENKLYLKPEKCTFESSEVNYLGIIVGNGTVQMDPKKVKAVKK